MARAKSYSCSLGTHPRPAVPPRLLGLGQERVVADCVLVDAVLHHILPNRRLQQPSGGPFEAHVLQQLSVGLIGSLVFIADVPDDAEAL